MTTETIDVPVVTLDGLLDGRRPRFVKIDVEGTELEVLRGAWETLTRARPVLVFEHQPTATEVDSQSRPIHRLLTSAGYRVFDIDGNGPLDERAMAHAARRHRVWNFIAIPV
jgi:hypothetical protein